MSRQLKPDNTFVCRNTIFCCVQIAHMITSRSVVMGSKAPVSEARFTASGSASAVGRRNTGVIDQCGSALLTPPTKGLPVVSYSSTYSRMVVHRRNILGKRPNCRLGWEVPFQRAAMLRQLFTQPRRPRPLKATSRPLKALLMSSTAGGWRCVNGDPSSTANHYVLSTLY